MEKKHQWHIPYCLVLMGIRILMIAYETYPFPPETTFISVFFGLRYARVARCFSMVSPAFGPLDCHTTPVALQCQGAFPWPLRAAVSGPSLAIGGPGWKVREFAPWKNMVGRQQTPQQERSETSKQLLIEGGFFLACLQKYKADLHWAVIIWIPLLALFHKALIVTNGFKSLRRLLRPFSRDLVHQKVMIPPEQWSNLMPFHHTA